MKRLFAVLVAALAAAALVTGSGTAGDAKGPPCTNVIGGGDTLGYASPNPTTGTSGSGVVEATFILAAPACSEATYTLSVYSFDGSTLLVSDIQPTSISGDTVFFHYEFPSGAPSDGVCLVGTVSWKNHVSDPVPDTGCAPVENGSAGGYSGWT